MLKILDLEISFHVKYRKSEPEGVHGQWDASNRNLRPKTAGVNGKDGPFTAYGKIKSTLIDNQRPVQFMAAPVYSETPPRYSENEENAMFLYG